MDKLYINFIVFFKNTFFFFFFNECLKCCPKCPHFFFSDSRNNTSRYFEPKIFGYWYLKSLKRIIPIHFIHFSFRPKLPHFLYFFIKLLLIDVIYCLLLQCIAYKNLLLIYQNSYKKVRVDIFHFHEIQLDTLFLLNWWGYFYGRLAYGGAINEHL